MKLSYRYSLAVIFLMLVSVSCSESIFSDGPPRNAISITVKANTSLKPWLEAAIVDFNDSRIKTATDKPIYVFLNSEESGQAVIKMTSGEPQPDLWIPDDQVWVDLLSEQGNPDFQDNCNSVAQSPLVIALWQPIAESLGWPGRDLGWLDVGSLAADPSAWDYYSGGQFGNSLRLGHTHPGLSATGVGTLLAVVQAAQSKSEAVSVEEIQLPIVQASVGAFEGAVSWFSSSTYTLGQTMRERGVNFLGAAIMYESTVFQISGGDPTIVPIYPFEGTFVARHPACMNNSKSEGTQEAVSLFRQFLIGEEAQQLALENGLRPINPNVPLGEPLIQTYGVDVSQPKVIFESPSVETLFAVQDLWKAARKDVNLVMLIDISGSMRGSKLANVQNAAIRFIEHMGDEDFISIIAFSQEPFLIVDHLQIGEARSEVIEEINGLTAGGNTPLYDAIGDGATLISQTRSSNSSNALVVLTDGMDTGSRRYEFDENLIAIASDNDTTVFAIAYGSDAEEDLLEELAFRANGKFYLGDEASIAMIYEEMSAAFGGTVGVGR